MSVNNESIYPEVILRRKTGNKVVWLTEGNAYWSENLNSLPWKIVRGYWINNYGSTIFYKFYLITRNYNYIRSANIFKSFNTITHIIISVYELFLRIVRLFFIDPITRTMDIYRIYRYGYIYLKDIDLRRTLFLIRNHANLSVVS